MGNVGDRQVGVCVGERWGRRGTDLVVVVLVQAGVLEMIISLGSGDLPVFRQTVTARAVSVAMALLLLLLLLLLWALQHTRQI